MLKADIIQTASQRPPISYCQSPQYLAFPGQREHQDVLPSLLHWGKSTTPVRREALRKSLHNLPTYIACLPDDSDPQSSILFLTDALGLKLANSELLANRHAGETNCKAVPHASLPLQLKPAALTHSSR
jgi:hypothetical protein